MNNVAGRFQQPMKAGERVDCGAATKVIKRFIGFFGMQETYCTHCRDCLPEEYRQDFDDLVAAVEAAREAARADYEERRRRSAARGKT